MPFHFDYLPGRIEARFSHDTFDSIHLDLHITPDTTVITQSDYEGHTSEPSCRQGQSGEFTVYMSSVFCAFRDFVAFLEAISVGVEDCSFSWEAEGPDGRLWWSRSAGGMGTLGLQWFSKAEGSDISVLVERHHAVQALYGAFRSFVESPQYDPFLYEALTVRDAIEVTLQEGTPADVVGVLAHASAAEVEDRLQRLSAWMHSRDNTWSLDAWPGVERDGYGGELHLVPPEWNAWPIAHRKARLGELLDAKSGSWYGANLRKMRSAIVEGFLSTTPADEAAAGDTILH